MLSLQFRLLFHCLAVCRREYFDDFFYALFRYLATVVQIFHLNNLPTLKRLKA